MHPMMRHGSQCLTRQFVLADFRKGHSKAEVGAKQIVWLDIRSAQSALNLDNLHASESGFDNPIRAWDRRFVQDVADFHQERTKDRPIARLVWVPEIRSGLFRKS
jgi:hypothetical protein